MCRRTSTRSRSRRSPTGPARIRRKRRSAPTYSASKIAVEHFASALRLELLGREITVGVAFPGWIDTDLVRDAKVDMPTFKTLLRELPWPFNVTTPVDVCGEALAVAIEKRRRRVFVPSVLAPFALFRTLMWTRLGEAWMARLARRRIPELEKDVSALSRSFGPSSVESKR